MLAACALLTAGLNAQITYVGNIALPGDASFLLSANGTVALRGGTASGHAIWTATPEIFRYSAGTYQPLDTQPPDALLLNDLSLVAQSGNPADPWIYATGPRFAFYAFDPVTHDLRERNLDRAVAGNSLASRGDLLALVADNNVYAIDHTTGATTLMIGTSGSGAGQIGTAGFGTFGHDGMFYLLDQQADGAKRVQRFDLSAGLTEAQRYLGGFTVDASLPLNAGIAVSRSGHMYIGDGAGGFFAYDTAGNEFEPVGYSFTGSPTPFGAGGVSSLTLDDDGYIYVFTAQTGMHQYYDAQGLTAVPEPSTYACLAGLAALVVAAARRRRSARSV